MALDRPANPRGHHSSAKSPRATEAPMFSLLVGILRGTVSLSHAQPTSTSSILVYDKVSMKIQHHNQAAALLARELAEVLRRKYLSCRHLDTVAVEVKQTRCFTSRSSEPRIHVSDHDFVFRTCACCNHRGCYVAGPNSQKSINQYYPPLQ